MKTQKSLVVLLPVMLLVALVLAACGAQPSGFPTGRFVSAANSHYYYTFNADGTWEYVEWGTVEATGTYTVEGDQWINGGDVTCPFPATYAWSFDGTNLTFTLVGQDECAGRRESTDGQTFVLQP